MNDRECGACGGKLEAAFDSKEYVCDHCGGRYPVDLGDPDYREYLKKLEDKKKRKALFLKVLAVIVLAAVLIALVVLAVSKIPKPDTMPPEESSNVSAMQLEDFHANDVKAPSSAESYIGVHAKTVAAELCNAGFDKVEFEKIDDIGFFDFDHKYGTIERVSINGNTSFTNDEWLPKNSKVLISYHAKASDEKYEPVINRDGQVMISRSAGDYKGKNYSEVVSELDNIGFITVDVEPTNDLTFPSSIIHHENDVAEVLINGVPDFNEGQWFSADSSVLVRYYSPPPAEG